MLGARSPRRIIAAAFQKQHYIALVNMGRVYPKFLENLWRYLTGRGRYPYDIRVRTPVGTVGIRLYTHHDLLTVNEVFCRLDYHADASLRYVVDLGANIGVSALYFLTRNSEAKCLLYEPDPKNVERLRRNLRGLENRYTLVQAAVSDRSGQVEFAVEPTGRYGTIASRPATSIPAGDKIVVDCVNINQVIRDALQESSAIDILKIDTEGVEIQTVEAMEPGLARRVSKVYLEATPAQDLHPDLFRRRQYGTVCQLIRKP